MYKMFGLSPSKRFFNLSLDDRTELQRKLNDLGIHKFSVDFEIIFHCDNDKVEEVQKIANEYGFNLVRYK